MEHARNHGYPVPAVAEVSDGGTDLVMQRVEGPSMFEALGRRPWTLRRNATLLADLHEQLHEISAPEWLPRAPVGTGDRLIHLDLHPLNVLLTARGPMVIDWSNAARGDPAGDVALTWLLLSAGSIPSGRLKAALLGRARALMVDGFLAPFDLDPVRATLAEVAEWKAADPHMSPAERQSMRTLVSVECG